MYQDFYNSNLFGFDQFQPPQFLVNYPPQETNKEILQSREDLMEAIQAFLQEYDHIPPNEKCVALLLAEERFLKIKQTMKEEQNQPGVMQELLLKLMNDLQILKGSQQDKETESQSFIPYWNFSMIDDEEARENFMKDICTFLTKFSRIPFGVMPKVLSIAWERFGKIKDALTDEQYQQEDIQELMSKLLEDVRNIRKELSEYINCPSWNRPTFYDNDDDEYTIIYSKPKAITPDLPIEEPGNSLIMGDEHLDTIPSVENLVLIPSEFEGISKDTCDVPVYEDPSTFDALSDHSEILSDSKDDGTSSDDDDCEDIEYVSLEEVNDVDQEDKDRLITNIESLNDNPTPDHVLKSPSLFIILVTNSDSFFEEFDTSLSHLDNSLPEFEPFSDDTECREDGSTHFHANNSLPEYDSFLFEIEPDQGELTNIVIEEVDTFLVPEDSIPLDVEISLIIETDAPMTIPSHLSFGLFSCFSPTLRILLYFSPPGVKTLFLTPASSLKAGGISSGWNFHHCVRTRQYLSMGEFGTDIKEMDKIKAKTDKAEHEKERVHKSRELSSYGQQKWHTIQRMKLMLGSKANIEGPRLEILDVPQGLRSLEKGSKLLEDKLELEELMGFRLLIK
ncbi:hypothetical protein Tco_0143926 [Tanacetum coccineum]